MTSLLFGVLLDSRYDGGYRKDCTKVRASQRLMEFEITEQGTGLFSRRGRVRRLDLSDAYMRMRCNGVRERSFVFLKALTYL